MKGLVLAAGRGIRLSPLTNTLVKPMIPIGGKPNLEHIIKSLKESEITDLTIVVGYQKEKIIRVLIFFKLFLIYFIRNIIDSKNQIT